MGEFSEYNLEAVCIGKLYFDSSCELVMDAINFSWCLDYIIADGGKKEQETYKIFGCSF